jgi:hypothetical protein
LEFRKKCKQLAFLAFFQCVKCVTCTKWRACISRAHFKEVLLSFDGMTLNTSAIGRKLVISRTTIAAWVGFFANAGLIRLLPFYGEHRRPLLFVRWKPLGNESRFRTEDLIAVLQRIFPTCGFYWWKTGRVRTVHLIADLGTERVGFCLCSAVVPQRKDWFPLLLALSRRVIHRAFFLHSDTAAFVKERAVFCLPWGAFLQEPQEWILRRRTAAEAREALRRINRERLARPPAPR